MHSTSRVAIVGLGVLASQASGVDDFWRLIHAGRDTSRPVPAGRWALPPEHALNPSGPQPDRVYSERGYFLDDIPGVPDNLAVSADLLAQLDPVFSLTVAAGVQAWRDARMESVDRQRVEVILGNIALPTDTASALAWEIVGGRIERELFGDATLSAARIHPFNRQVAGLPAGILAQALGLGGGSFTLDAACASSLYAVKLAVAALQSGRCDAVLTGGVSRPACLYTQMGFSQLRALSPSGRCSPFDAQADGLVVGEGAGVLVLKRLDDALAHGDHIYGVIAGIGVANDVHGNLLAPDSEGQLRAMRAAYQQAEWHPWDVDLIECHATGTPIGDAVEFHSLCELWRSSPRVERACILGAVKASVGHTLTAAGAMGLIKVLLALREQTLPPGVNFTQPAAPLGYDASPFRLLAVPQPWAARGERVPRRAGVNAFGFGGINAHLLVEEYQTPVRRYHALPQTEPLAIVALDAHFGSAQGVAAVARRLFGSPDPSESRMEELRVALDEFRIPPKELAETLPQQLLLLQVVARALLDLRGTRPDPLKTGVFLGIELDLNTTNYHLRWMLQRQVAEWNVEHDLNLTPAEVDDWLQQLLEAVGPALNANRVMGNLGSIAASRVARQFHLGGPSFTLASEELSGVHALRSAAQLLQQGELDAAIVGAVDFPADLRAAVSEPPLGDGAAVVVLKRHADAVRDGDKVYALLDAVAGAAGTLHDAATSARLGNTGAVSGFAAVLHGVLCLHHQIEPGMPTPRRWVHDRSAGPRQLVVTCSGSAGQQLTVGLRAGSAEPTDNPVSRHEGLFALSLESIDALLALSHSTEEIDRLAQQWYAQLLAQPHAQPTTLAVVARHPEELRQLLATAKAELAARPDTPLNLGDRLYYAPYPLAQQGEVAFVFPGSGSHFAGMGRELAGHFPAVVRRHDQDTAHLRGQLLPDLFWSERLPEALTTAEQIIGQVALGALVSDILQSFSLQPTAALGYSLGESAALFALRAWTDRDGMFERLRTGTLFTSALAGRCDAARHYWNVPESEPVDWVAGVVPLPAARVQQALAGRPDVFLLFVNTPRETVLGGRRAALNAVVAELGCGFVPLRGISTVHCPITRAVAHDYRQLHLLPTTPPPGVRFYSSASGHAYELTRESAADAIVAQALDTVDFARLIEQAYRDGVRLFVEIGPGSSCSRMIGQILGARPHLARSACTEGDALSSLLRLLAQLLAEGVTLDLTPLYGVAEAANTSGNKPGVTIPVHYQLPPLPEVKRVERPYLVPVREEVRMQRFSPPVREEGDILTQTFAAMLSARADAQSSLLHMRQNLMDVYADYLGWELQLVQGGGVVEDAEVVVGAPPQLDRAQCLEFAIGSIARVLGPAFAEIDNFPTRVRLPDEPLMLVDRITLIEGEPLSLTSGRVVTEHDVHAGAWYLDGGRMPTCIAVEAGQADLFLSGYLGIDLRTHGLSVYRLLDAEVTFHRSLPQAGETIRYDIHIDHFFRQGETYLFRFHFEGTVNGEPLLSMRKGCAGFFTATELNAGKGIVLTGLQTRPQPQERSALWDEFVPLTAAAYSAAQLDALRAGDLAGCFGPAFAELPLQRPLTIPGGTMRVVDRVTHLEPRGGRFGLGLIRAEMDVDPHAWFLTCHFVDDRVMPGTLMYECCMHTLRIFLLRMGIVGEEGQTVFEPVPGVASRLKCRGQVLESTRLVTYEVVLKQFDYRPAPTFLADAFMYADGKLIVEIGDMSVQASGLTHEALQQLWQGAVRQWPYDQASVLAFAVGYPSEAFGEPYRPFDRERFIARLPGPPYAFLDRVDPGTTPPWVLTEGGTIVAEYDVPADEWYFAAERQPTMPFAVLLEVALQPCGWMAAYMGSALTSDVDLCFRNLGGKALQHRLVTPETGTLRTTIRCTRFSRSAGMIIQNYDMRVEDRQGVVYEGDTNFGFFTREALAQQVGIRDRSLYEPTAAEQARGRRFAYPQSPPFPDRQMRMLDEVDLYVADGGPHGLGLLMGSKTVDANEWFFKAHFYLDPVWPGSLGLEALIQLLKVAAVERWGASAKFIPIVSARPHRWVYRGQVLPTCRQVIVQAWVTAWDDVQQSLVADGLLAVDGRIIYSMTDFALTLARD